MDQDTEFIEQSIARDRAELAETIDALAQRMDVKQRVRDSVEQRTNELRTHLEDVTPDDVRAKLDELREMVRANPVPVLLLAAFAAGLVLGRFRGRR